MVVFGSSHNSNNGVDISRAVMMEQIVLFSLLFSCKDREVTVFDASGVLVTC